MGHPPPKDFTGCHLCWTCAEGANIIVSFYQMGKQGCRTRGSCGSSLAELGLGGESHILHAVVTSTEGILGLEDIGI